MIVMEGEITEVSCPPNKADQYRNLTIWLPETEDHIEFTVFLTQFKEAGMKEGDKIKLQIDKAFDIDEFAQNLFQGR